MGSLRDQQLLGSRLSSRIFFLSQEKTRDLQTGNLIVSWVNLLDTSAEVIVLGGEETVVATAASSIIRYKINVRGWIYPKLSPDMRIEYNGRTLEIKTVSLPFKDYCQIIAEDKQGVRNG